MEPSSAPHPNGGVRASPAPVAAGSDEDAHLYQYRQQAWPLQPPGPGQAYYGAEAVQVGAMQHGPVGVPMAYPVGYAQAPPGVYPVAYGPPSQQAMEAQTPAVNVPVENTDYCNRPCISTCCRWGTCYVILIVLSSLLAFTRLGLLYVLSMLLLATLPAITILSFLERRFRKSLIRMQMVFTFFEALLWMIPIVILENIVDLLLIGRTKLPSEGTCAKCLLGNFLQAFVVAGLFEETVKYCAVRRIYQKPFVVDPRALVVYSCCAGAAFGTIEDLGYNLSYGPATAIVRAFTSVPLHCATALVMGISLAGNRFLEGVPEKWYKTLVIPIFVHGTYDVITFTLSSKKTSWIGLIVGIFIVVATYLYVRRGVLILLKACPVEQDVHVKILSGEVSPPSCLCCNPEQCSACYF